MNVQQIDESAGGYLRRVRFYLSRLSYPTLLWVSAHGILNENSRLGSWLRVEADAELGRQRRERDDGEIEEPEALVIDFSDWSGEDVAKALRETDIMGRRTTNIEFGEFIDRLHTLLLREAATRLRLQDLEDAEREIW